MVPKPTAPGQRLHLSLIHIFRDLGVYSEIYPHDITADELKSLENVKGVVLNGGENRVVDGMPVDIDTDLYGLSLIHISSRL